MTFLSNKKVVTNDMESATTTLAQRVGFEPTGDCSHDGFRVLWASIGLKAFVGCFWQFYIRSKNLDIKGFSAHITQTPENTGEFE